jgi:ketosteroid isomerase-like protein
MAERDIETIRELYAETERFLREFPDFEVSEILDPEIEWIGPREFPDLAEPHHGHAGVRSYFEKLFEAIEDYRMEPEEFIDAGEGRVLVFSREGGRGAGSGAEVVTQPTAHLWTLRDGRAIRMQSYWERDEALAAAGLSS